MGALLVLLNKHNQALLLLKKEHVSMCRMVSRLQASLSRTSSWEHSCQLLPLLASLVAASMLAVVPAPIRPASSCQIMSERHSNLKLSLCSSKGVLASCCELRESTCTRTEQTHESCPIMSDCVESVN